jgi:hypothetical protein
MCMVNNFTYEYQNLCFDIYYRVMLNLRDTHRILNKFYNQVYTVLYFYLYKTPVLSHVTLPHTLT